MLLQPMTEEQLQYDGFFDGENEIIADNAVMKFEVLDCFHGMNESGLMQCYVNVKLVESGKYSGQIYKYNAKLWDMNAQNRDKAMTNLGVLDAQAGLPMTRGSVQLSTESMNEHFAGLTAGDNGELVQTGKPVRAMLKMRLMHSTEDMNGNKHLDEEGNETTKSFNWVSGFAYSREDMAPVPSEDPQQTTEQQTPVDEPEIDF